MTTSFDVAHSVPLERMSCDGHEHVIRISTQGQPLLAMCREVPTDDGPEIKVQAVRPIRRRSTGKKQADEVLVTMFALQLAVFLPGVKE